MSANNFLLIEKYSTRFRVFDVDADDCYKRKIDGEEWFDTLEEAIKAANKYQKENEVEYGLQIDI